MTRRPKDDYYDWAAVYRTWQQGEPVSRPLSLSEIAELFRMASEIGLNDSQLATRIGRHHQQVSRWRRDLKAKGML